jgi:hypothetical protein
MEIGIGTFILGGSNDWVRTCKHPHHLCTCPRTFRNGAVLRERAEPSPVDVVAGWSARHQRCFINPSDPPGHE